MNVREYGHFQVWEYKISHRQLLLRRPATERSPGNVDLVFGGVKYVSLPSSVKDPAIREAGIDDLRVISGLTGQGFALDEIHIIEGTDARGFVVASTVRRIVNELDLYETGLENWADPRSAAERLERSVLLALAPLSPVIEPAFPISSGRFVQLDALIRIENVSIGIEVAWISPTGRSSSVRDKVIRAVERLNPWVGYLGGVLIVVGIDAESATRQIYDLQEYLDAAVGSFMRVLVIPWAEGDNPQHLIDGVRRLAAI